MSEPEKMLRNFLQRWSLRKLGLEERPKEPPPVKTEQAEGAESHEPGAPNPPIETSARSADSAVEPFDLARLPPIESIDASTDIRAFLVPGIPAELRRAALRRAWLSDPAIRDFVGLAENQWDFTNPDAVPGFGSLELTPELRRLVAEAFGEPPARDADASETTPSAEAIATTSTLGSNAPTAAVPDLTSGGTVTPVPCPDVAPQSDCAAEEREHVHVKPKHGGALPQ
jgi:hypothetical protein